MAKPKPSPKSNAAHRPGREIARHAEFAATVEQIIAENEKICEARRHNQTGAA